VSFSQSVDAATGGCCTANSCAFGYLDAESVEVGSGGKFVYNFDSQAGSDWYEVVVAVFKEEVPLSGSILVDSKMYRGSSITGFDDEISFTGVPGSYFLRFFAASYDETGGRALGASLDVNSFSFVGS